MSFVVYHKDTTVFMTTKRRKYSYATQQAAKAAISREAKTQVGFNRSDYLIADQTVFHDSIEKKEIRHGIVHSAGKEFEVGVNTSWTSGPWSETYWSS